MHKSHYQFNLYPLPIEATFFTNEAHFLHQQTHEYIEKNWKAGLFFQSNGILWVILWHMFCNGLVMGVADCIIYVGLDTIP